MKSSKFLKAYKKLYLWIKQQLKILNLRYPLLKWAVVLVLGIFIVTAAKFKIDNGLYGYIDLDGNRGVATWCKVDNGNLICTKVFNGKVQVKQYWKLT